MGIKLCSVLVPDGVQHGVVVDWHHCHIQQDAKHQQTLSERILMDNVSLGRKISTTNRVLRRRMEVNLECIVSSEPIGQG